MATKTRANLKSIKDINLADGSNITAVEHREVVNDIIDSQYNKLDDTAFSVIYGGGTVGATLDSNVASISSIDGRVTALEGASAPNITTVNSSSYNVISTDYVLHVTYSTIGSTTITIPTAQATSGRILIIKDASGASNTNAITVGTQGAEKIDGLDTYAINTNYQSVNIYSNGTNWFIY